MATATPYPQVALNSRTRSSAFLVLYLVSLTTIMATGLLAAPAMYQVFGDSFVSENQHQGVMVAYDQIQLPITGSVVALDEGVSSPPQVAQGELFAPRPREPVVQPPTPA